MNKPGNPDLTNPVPYGLIELAEHIGIRNAKDVAWQSVDLPGMPGGEEVWPSYCPCHWAAELNRVFFDGDIYYVGQCRSCDTVLWHKRPD